MPSISPRSQRCLIYALAVVLLSSCGTVPLSSMWKMRSFKFEDIDPVLLRAALVYPSSLVLDTTKLRLEVSVARQVKQADGSMQWERLEEKLPLEEVHGAAELSGLQDERAPGKQFKAWRIAPAALPKLIALRSTALSWKKTDDGKRTLSLGLKFEGCRAADAPKSIPFSSLLKFTAQGEYIALVRNADLVDLLPAPQLALSFPVCKTP